MKRMYFKKFHYPNCLIHRYLIHINQLAQYESESWLI